MRLLVNQNALELQLSFSSTKRFWNIGGGEFRAKIYFTDCRTANTAICCCKSKLFWSIIFFNIWQRGKIS